MCDVADPHFALIGERNGDNVLSIQVFVDHAAAHGISVQADQKVEQRVGFSFVFMPATFPFRILITRSAIGVSAEL